MAKMYQFCVSSDYNRSYISNNIICLTKSYIRITECDDCVLPVLRESSSRIVHNGVIIIRRPKSSNKIRSVFVKVMRMTNKKKLKTDVVKVMLQETIRNYDF